MVEHFVMVPAAVATSRRSLASAWFPRFRPIVPRDHVESEEITASKNERMPPLLQVNEQGGIELHERGPELVTLMRSQASAPLGASSW